jgi:hypothetical protein
MQADGTMKRIPMIIQVSALNFYFVNPKPLPYNEIYLKKGNYTIRA